MHRLQSSSFFKFIYNTFGSLPVQLLKGWIKNRLNIYKCKLRIRFLKFCIQFNIVPPHLYSLSKLSMYLRDRALKMKLNDVKALLTKRLLKMELNDAYRSVNYFWNSLFRLARNITNNLPFSITKRFFDTREKSLYTFFIRECVRIDRKCDWLIHKRDSASNGNIKPLKYFWFSSEASLDTSPSAINKKISLTIPSTHHGSSLEISINPSFNDSPPRPPFSSLFQCLLQLGNNFSLPYTNKKHISMEFVKNIENNIKNFESPTQNIIRNRAIPIVNSFFSHCPQINKFDSELVNLQKLSKQFLKNNSELILTKADKGNITVALDKTEYLNNINLMLQDTDTYSRLTKNPINKLVSSVKVLLVRWKKLDYISTATYRALYCSDGILPRAYGLPKVHKPGCPYRIIISTIDSPLHLLATCLHNIINSGIPKAKTRIDNSFFII